MNWNGELMYLFRQAGQVLDSFYAALFEWNIRRWGGDEYMASFLTACGLGGAMIFNVVVVSGAVAAWLGPQALALGVTYGLFLIIAGISYARFVRQNRYIQLAQDFRGRPRAEQKRLTKAAWVYVIPSYLAPLGFALIMNFLTP